MCCIASCTRSCSICIQRPTWTLTKNHASTPWSQRTFLLSLYLLHSLKIPLAILSSSHKTLTVLILHFPVALHCLTLTKMSAHGAPVTADSPIAVDAGDAPVVSVGMSGIPMHSEQRQDLDLVNEPYSVFPAAMRTYLTYLFGVVMILSSLTASIYSPLIPLLSKEFHVSIQAINLTNTVYSIFQGVSPGIFASLADAFGRRPVLLALLALYSAASLGLSLNRKSYATLMALRALQSIGGSATAPIAYGVAADLVPSAERGKLLGPMLSTCNAISTAGPIIGGALALGTGGFRWVFISLLIIAVVLLVIVGLTLPETGRSVVGNGSLPARSIWGKTWWSLLTLSTQGENKTGRPEEQGASSQQRPKEPWKPWSLLSSLRIMVHPDAASVLCVVAVSYVIYSTLMTAVPTLFEDIYGFNSLEQGCAVLPALAGVTCGGLVAGRLMDRNYDKSKTAGNGCINAIERARYRHCIPVILAEVALLTGYGWAIEYRVHPAAPLVLEFFAVATSTIMAHTSSALLVDIFPDIASTAYASGQIARCGLTAISVAVLQRIIDAVGKGWYFSILALFFSTCSSTCIFISCTVGVQWRIKRQTSAQE